MRFEAPAVSRADFIKNLQEAGLEAEDIEALTPSDEHPVLATATI